MNQGDQVMYDRYELSADISEPLNKRQMLGKHAPACVEEHEFVAFPERDRRGEQRMIVVGKKFAIFDNDGKRKSILDRSLGYFANDALNAGFPSYT
jgi:hypothetical protein